MVDRGDTRGELHELADRLHSASIHLLRRLRKEDAAGGLTGPRLSALSVVVLAGPVSMGALAAAEQVSPPTMTRLVSGLEAEGLVVRGPDPDDGRVVLVRSTPAGRDLLTRGRARRVAALAADLAVLGPAEREHVRRGLAALEGVLGSGPLPWPEDPPS